MKTFENFIDPRFDSLNESEQNEIDGIIEKLKGYSPEELTEGLLGDIVGGSLGFLIGPSIGKKIANALGIESGILYDLFTSRLVSAALGVAIARKD